MNDDELYKKNYKDISTDVEAFKWCNEVFLKIKDNDILKDKETYKDKELALEHARARPSRMGAVKNEPPTGRRAAIEHTKRKIADE